VESSRRPDYSLRYVVPVHNDGAILESTVDTLTRTLSSLPGAKHPGHHHVLLVENGSRDDSWQRCQALVGERLGVIVHAFREPSAGLGYAIHRGINEAERLPGDPSAAWIVLTASDLPFDFSDLEAWLADPGDARMYIGSKAHPGSAVPSSPLRGVMSRVYQLARRAALDMHTRDSQGTFVFRQDLATSLARLVVSRDYFYTTELVYFAEQRGEQVVELPVRLAPSRRPSTVHPLRDGTRMLRSLLRLRRRSPPRRA